MWEISRRGEAPRGPEQPIGVDLVDGQAGVIVVVRRVHVRAVVDAARELPHVAGRAVAKPHDQLIVKGRVPRPRREGVGMRVGDVDGGHGPGDKTAGSPTSRALRPWPAKSNVIAR